MGDGLQVGALTGRLRRTGREEEQGRVRGFFQKDRRREATRESVWKRLKHWLRNLSLRKSYVLYMLIAMGLSVILCIVVVNLLEDWRYEHLVVRYRDSAAYYDVPEDGSVTAQSENLRYTTFMIRDAQNLVLEEFTVDEYTEEYIVTEFYASVEAPDDAVELPAEERFSADGNRPKRIMVKMMYSEQDQMIDFLCGMLGFLCIPVFFIGGAIMSSALFYRNKLRQPLKLLNYAAARIAEDDLDFALQYDRMDEMGRLCMAFESMRASLAENNRKLWRSVEERKRLNAAFAHDLRTPLTVLKGYADMMIKFAPDENCPRGKLVATARTMSRHVLRIEGYVNSMSDIQRLEDLPCHPEPLAAAEFLAGMRDAMQMLCEEQNRLLDFRSTPMTQLSLDRALVCQVWENLLRNALRYASNCVRVECWLEDGEFRLSVANDGPTFTQEELHHAADAYYSNRKNPGSGDEAHFGLGLHICRLICEKHGGSLWLENHPQYGATVIACFKMP